METLLVPLSDLDRNGTDGSAVVIGYALRPEESLDPAAKLELALTRVVDKWRLLAGRIEWDDKNTRWVVRVPISSPLPLDYPTHLFSTSTSSSPLGVELPTLTPTSATFLPILPSVTHFRSPTAVAASSKEFASKQAPLLALHVSYHSDCTCVGISFPHGLFDATGMGQVLQALDAELHGREWTPPPLAERNLVTETLPLLPKGEKSVVPVMRDFVGSNWRTFVWTLASLAYEYLWQKTTVSSLFLGEEMVNAIVDPVKKEVFEQTGEWVSSNDVLIAWMFKSAYLDEPTNPNSLTSSSVFSIRPVLAALASSPSFATYPHNCGQLFPLPLLSISTLSATPLSTIALSHRRTLSLSRTPSFVQSTMEWTREQGGSATPARRIGTDSWMVTNQVVAGLTNVEWGARSEGFWLWDVPLMPDHVIKLNKFRGGYLVISSMRASRWKAVASELERLKGNGERRVV